MVQMVQFKNAEGVRYFQPSGSSVARTLGVQKINLQMKP